MAARPKRFRDEVPCVSSRLPDGWYASMDLLCAEDETAWREHTRGFTLIQVEE